MVMKFTNNASTSLLTGITNSATTLTVATGKGALFPPLPLGSDYFYATIINVAGTISEIVLVTALSGDTMTISRGVDNSTALAWLAGDTVELRLVAINVKAFPVIDQANTFSADNIFSSTGAVRVSGGTTAQRPTPTVGMVRYNTTTSLFEGYSGATPAWQALGAPAGSGSAYTGPVFSAVQNVLQAVLTATWTRIKCQSVEFDTNVAYDNVTNFRFQPQTAGYYQITAGLGWDPALPPVSQAASIYKNGAEFKRGSFYQVNNYSSVASALVFLNGSSDYVELWGYQAQGSTVNTSPNFYTTYFQGVIVR